MIFIRNMKLYTTYEIKIWCLLFYTQIIVISSNLVLFILSLLLPVVLFRTMHYFMRQILKLLIKYITILLFDGGKLKTQAQFDVEKKKKSL